MHKLPAHMMTPFLCWDLLHALLGKPQRHDVPGLNREYLSFPPLPTAILIPLPLEIQRIEVLTSIHQIKCKKSVSAKKSTICNEVVKNNNFQTANTMHCSVTRYTDRTYTTWQLVYDRYGQLLQVVITALCSNTLHLMLTRRNLLITWFVKVIIHLLIKGIMVGFSKAAWISLLVN